MESLLKERRFGAGILLALLLLVPITIFDLRVSELVVDRANVVGRFVSDYGEIPGYVLIQFALLFVIVVTKSIVERICYVLYLLFLVLLLFGKLLDSVNEMTAGLILLLTGALFVFSSLRLTTNEALLRYSRITALLATVCPLFLVQTMKWLWGRTRFRDLRADHSDFTPWFLPLGPTGERSFPSGHAAMGWMLLPLMLLARTRRQFNCIAACVMAWGMLVCAGRVISGAHYLSDVYWSTLISVSTCVILDQTMNRPDRQFRSDDEA